MTLLPCPIPSPPGWHVDWQALHEQFEWIRAMKGCPQDPVYHAEGDVWIHVRMVCESLAALEEWRLLPESGRDLLFAAALLHDVAKPSCTRMEDGRITSRGHSQRGAIQARQILWQHGADLGMREQICALVRFHQTPFHLIDREEAPRTLRRISQLVRCDHLAILARADAQGRRCQDQDGLLTKVELFEELCREQGCFDRPWPFPSALSRFEYFRREGRDPYYHAHDESRCEAILMSGLPGSGKDSWIRAHAADWNVISLDDIREEADAEPAGNQGAVIQAAKERARVFLRQGMGFVWNATNLNRELRSQLVDFFAAYRARVRIVYVEAPHDEQFGRNQNRTRAVPHRAIERMMGRWEVPDVSEAPAVEWWENGESWTRRLSG